MSADVLYPMPATRSLRIFAFDPGLAGDVETAGIGEVVVDVPWEVGLMPGPVGEYVEVVDVDPASGVAYRPVDLNHPHVLARGGLAPSESNPQFHQQMVYAVAMATIGQFEQALGRVALWADHHEGHGAARDRQFIRRLRIYPHALRERNAYYSPDKKALLFGYFEVGRRDDRHSPATTVFTCLSHDIIAHETTHALLDGVHPRFREPVNDDVLAFHEAFADIVALFQHFGYPGVLRDQIGRTRGELATENLLGQLAQQFGRATARGHALRDALGDVDETTGQWKPRTPDPHALSGAIGPHARGSILVAAVFDAFLRVYQTRTRDLYRVATGGTGVLQAGAIHPDLINRLADEAARAAQQILQMAIRAIDYCPPVGITFGDYLRAIVTADLDLNPEDRAGYRLAFLDSFRRWGITPSDLRSATVEGLYWPTDEELLGGHADAASAGRTSTVTTASPKKRAANWYQITRQSLPAVTAVTTAESGEWDEWDLDTDRYASWAGIERNCYRFREWLLHPDRQRLARAIGLVLDHGSTPPTVIRSRDRHSGTLSVAVEVHSVRTAVRRTARGVPTTDLVVEVTQRRAGFFDEARQAEADAASAPFFVNDDELKFDFSHRAGCTLLVDPSTMRLRRVIRTPGDIIDPDTLARARAFLTTGLMPPNAFDSPARRPSEPFALLHRSGEIRHG